MSIPTFIIFENDDDCVKIGTNLGWVFPSDFQLAKLIIYESEKVDKSFKWDRLRIARTDLGYMTKESFDVMKIIVEKLESEQFKQYINRFTLNKSWIKQ